MDIELIFVVKILPTEIAKRMWKYHVTIFILISILFVPFQLLTTV